VKWFDAAKGFGFIQADDGFEVFLHAEALPLGVTTLKAGTKVDFGVADGKRGPSALSVQLLEPQPSVVRAKRPAPAEMVTIVEDLIRQLDDARGRLSIGKYPEGAKAATLGKVLHAVGDIFEA
jgi:CspA family cold shock protein